MRTSSGRRSCRTALTRPSGSAGAEHGTPPMGEARSEQQRSSRSALAPRPRCGNVQPSAEGFWVAGRWRVQTGYTHAGSRRDSLPPPRTSRKWTAPHRLPYRILRGGRRRHRPGQTGGPPGPLRIPLSTPRGPSRVRPSIGGVPKSLRPGAGAKARPASAQPTLSSRVTRIGGGKSSLSPFPCPFPLRIGGGKSSLSPFPFLSLCMDHG